MVSRCRYSLTSFHGRARPGLCSTTVEGPLILPRSAASLSKSAWCSEAMSSLLTMSFTRAIGFVLSSWFASGRLRPPPPDTSIAARRGPAGAPDAVPAGGPVAAEVVRAAIGGLLPQPHRHRVHLPAVDDVNAAGSYNGANPYGWRGSWTPPPNA